MAKKNSKSKVCPFKSGKIPATEIDYKNVKFLRKYITNVGKIVQSRVTGVSRYYQRAIAHEIKIARYLGLIPYCDNHK